MLAFVSNRHKQKRKLVKWITSIDQISKEVIALQFDATIAEKWHLYSLEEFIDGPLPTEFTFVFDSLKIQLDGKTTSEHTKQLLMRFFKLIYPSFDKAVQFLLVMVKLLDPKAKEISGEINYQACDDRVCIFRTEPFKISLDGSEVKLDQE